MKIELRKVNEPTGRYWYGIWVDDNCTTPAYGNDYDAALAAYNHIVEKLKTPKPKEEVIFSTEIEPVNA